MTNELRLQQQMMRQMQNSHGIYDQMSGIRASDIQRQQYVIAKSIDPVVEEMWKCYGDDVPGSQIASATASAIVFNPQFYVNPGCFIKVNGYQQLEWGNS